jgi:glucose/mannose-6-phosphate isomerase
MELSTSPLSHFKEQFDFVPEVKNKETLTDYTRVVVCGMGGSAISVSLLKLLFPELPISLHNSYGLPPFFDKKETLLIINSYSGNTEEALDAFEQGKKNGANMAVLGLGGALIQNAKDAGGAYLILPESSLEPRFSIGHQIIGLLTLLDKEDKIMALKKKIEFIDLPKVETNGRALAEKYNGKFPVIYASANLYPVAYLIKAAINEGAKVPSFVNQIPEANHNELQSFITDESHTSSEHFSFLILTSPFDHVRILKRFTIMESMYQEKGFMVTALHTDHTDILKIFELILTGYYMATYMAIAKNINPYKTPFIAEFKKRLTA